MERINNAVNGNARTSDVVAGVTLLDIALHELKAQKKTQAATWVEREFQSAWKDADLKLDIGSL
jgi:hypothetical protein